MFVRSCWKPRSDEEAYRLIDDPTAARARW